MDRKSFWLSFGSMCLSIITIVLFFVKVSPNSIVDSNTFISVLAAFIGVSVTLLLGYQIYNVVEMRDKLAKIDELQKQLSETKDNLQQQILSQSEGFNIIQARLYSKDLSLQTLSFTLFLCAIHDALSLDHKDDGYDWMLDELKTYMLELSANHFNGGKEQREEKINDFKKEYAECDKLIRQHPKYYVIRRQYEEYMTAFDERLELLREGKIVSIEIINAEWNNNGESC